MSFFRADLNHFNVHPIGFLTQSRVPLFQFLNGQRVWNCQYTTACQTIRIGNNQVDVAWVGKPLAVILPWVLDLQVIGEGLPLQFNQIGNQVRIVSGDQSDS